MAYNYLESVKEDVLQYIEDELDLSDYSSRDDLEQQLNLDLWSDDSVTGNGRGSYTFNHEKANQYALDFGFDGLTNMVSAWGIEAHELAEHLEGSDWEWFVVSLRRYWLAQAIDEALDEVWDRD